MKFEKAEAEVAGVRGARSRPSAVDLTKGYGRVGCLSVCGSGCLFIVCVIVLVILGGNWLVQNANGAETGEPIPIDLEIRHRGSLEIKYYEFRVVYHRSPSYQTIISYYAPRHPKYNTISLWRKGQPRLTVRAWIIPPPNAYQFDVSVRVVGVGYNSAWSDSVTMISEF